MSVITVTGTGDAINATDGVVTLREAITAANSNKNISDVVGVGAYGNDTIAFNIPGTGVQTIRPTSALPTITDPVTIDGYTQPGSPPTPIRSARGSTARCSIEIDGENAGDVRFGMLEIQDDQQHGARPGHQPHAGVEDRHRQRRDRRRQRPDRGELHRD